jgi:hypothetical protein
MRSHIQLVDSCFGPKALLQIDMTASHVLRSALCARRRVHNKINLSVPHVGHVLLITSSRDTKSANTIFMALDGIEKVTRDAGVKLNWESVDCFDFSAIFGRQPCVSVASRTVLLTETTVRRPIISDRFRASFRQFLGRSTTFLLLLLFYSTTCKERKGTEQHPSLD